MDLWSVPSRFTGQALIPCETWSLLSGIYSLVVDRSTNSYYNHGRPDSGSAVIQCSTKQSHMESSRSMSGDVLEHAQCTHAHKPVLAELDLDCGRKTLPGCPSVSHAENKLKKKSGMKTSRAIQVRWH